jgi:hypothetical protein
VGLAVNVDDDDDDDDHHHHHHHHLDGVRLRL